MCLGVCKHHLHQHRTPHQRPGVLIAELLKNLSENVFGSEAESRKWRWGTNMFCFSTVGDYCAAGATWGECQRPRRSRRCSLVGILRESGGLVWGPVLWTFASGICIWVAGKQDAGDLKIGPNLSVCVMFVYFFLQRVFESTRWYIKGNFKKNRVKKGFCD